MKRPTALLLGVLLALSLAACTPRFQAGIEDAVRAFADGPGGAQLVIADEAVVFAAGSMDRFDVVLYVGGESLATTDPACAPLRNGIACFVDEGGRDVPAGELARVAVTGARMSVNVSYYLEDHPIPFGFYVSDKPPSPPPAD